MKITFLGVGEAFDHKQANTSIILETNRSAILLDCGYSAFAKVWQHNLNPDHIDFIYISHTHADHSFGIAPLIKRMNEEKRSKKLTVICPKGSANHIKKIIDLAYGAPIKKAPYEIEFLEVDEMSKLKLKDLSLTFAKTKHSTKNMAIRIDNNNKVICYSGDGEHTLESTVLFKNADLLIHDSYHLDLKTEGHDNISDVYDFSKKIDIKKLAFTHIQRDERKHIKKITEKIKAFKIKSLVPGEGDSLTI